MCKQNVCRQDIENTFLFHSESGSVLKILHNRIENQRQFRKKNLICTWNTLKGVYGIGQYLSTEKPPIYVICTDIFVKIRDLTPLVDQSHKLVTKNPKS